MIKNVPPCIITARGNEVKACFEIAKPIKGTQKLHYIRTGEKGKVVSKEHFESSQLSVSSIV